ncbi:hypothetical protein B0H11DRAFT_2358342 [Mycena galericulata]|nr:hypothetical protein B0H11DRAFT_2358342 [Mycena galericulata]
MASTSGRHRDIPSSAPKSTAEVVTTPSAPTTDAPTRTGGYTLLSVGQAFGLGSAKDSAKTDYPPPVDGMAEVDLPEADASVHVRCDLTDVEEYPEAVPSATRATALLGLDGVDLAADEAFVPARLQQNATSVGSVYVPLAEAGGLKKKEDELWKDASKHDARTSEAASDTSKLSLPAKILTRTYLSNVERARVVHSKSSATKFGGLEGRSGTPDESSKDSQGEVPFTSKESLFSPAPSIPTPETARGWANVEAVRAVHSESSATDTAATVRSRKAGLAHAAYLADGRLYAFGVTISSPQVPTWAERILGGKDMTGVRVQVSHCAHSWIRNLIPLALKSSPSIFLGPSRFAVQERFESECADAG